MREVLKSLVWCESESQIVLALADSACHIVRVTSFCTSYMKYDGKTNKTVLNNMSYIYKGFYHF
jgi:hypothetical protein